MKFSDNGIPQALLDAVAEVNKKTMEENTKEVLKEENLQELSKKTIGTYVKRAAEDKVQRDYLVGKYDDMARQSRSDSRKRGVSPQKKKTLNAKADNASDNASYHNNALNNRNKGINIAVNKLVGIKKARGVRNGVRVPATDK